MEINHGNFPENTEVSWKYSDKIVHRDGDKDPGNPAVRRKEG
jgi:hypothetical protein